MIRFFTQVLSTVLIVLTLGLLIRIIAKENEAELIRNLKEEHVTIHYPVAYRWVGVICTMFSFGILTLIITNSKYSAEIWMYVEISMFILLGLYIIVATYLWKINIHKNDAYFVYTSSFGRKYKIYCSDIVGYRNGKNYIKLKTAKRSFFVDNKAINVEYLLRMLKKNHISFLP